MNRDPVSVWAETGGIRLGPVSATGSLDALAPLGVIVGDACVVGIGVQVEADVVARAAE